MRKRTFAELAAVAAACMLVVICATPIFAQKKFLERARKAILELRQW